MVLSGDVARVHCSVVSAETYLSNAVSMLKGIGEEERPQGVLKELRCALVHLEYAKPSLEGGVSPETLELLRGTVIPLERVARDVTPEDVTVLLETKSELGKP